MSQYYSRLHIKVSSPKIWSRFEDADDASFGLAKLANTNNTSFVMDEWSSTEEELTGIVSALAETIGEDGIIIADTSNFNVDPYNYCIYYLGDRVHTEVFTIDGDEDKCEMHHEVSIGDVPGWLSYGEFSISKKEKEVLFGCGISSVGGHFMEFSTDHEILEQAYLRETSFKKRPDVIEQTFVGEEVFFVHSKDSYDPLRLEVMSNLGSLGYLPSEVSDKITPMLLNKRLKYMARVTEVIPASKRNKHAKSSIVSISIEAEFSDKEVPVKNSVPKIDREVLAAEAACKAEEERKRKEEEACRVEEERKRWEAACRAEEECKRKEEEARIACEKAEAEVRARKEAEEKRKAEEEHKRKEEEARIACEKAEAEVRARKEAEEKRKAEEERKRKEQEIVLKKYQEEHATWEKECDAVKNKRADAVAKRLSEEKAKLEFEARNRYDAAVKIANDKKAEQTRKKYEAESALARLGFFKFNDKKIQKANIEAAIASISDAEADIKRAEENYKSEMSAVTSKVSALENSIKSDAEKQNPFPKEPVKPLF